MPLILRTGWAFVCSALFGLVFFGWAAWDLSLSRERLLTSARGQSISSAQLVSRSLDIALSRVDLVLQQVLSDRGHPLAQLCGHAHPQSSRDNNRYLAHELALIPESQSLRVSGIDGNFCADATGTLPDFNIGDRAYVRQHQNNPNSGLVISEPILAKVTHNWVITVSRQLPRPPDGQYVGQVQTALNQGYFTAIIQQSGFANDNAIEITNPGGRLMAMWPEQPGRSGTVVVNTPFLPQLVQGHKTGSYQTSSHRHHPGMLYGWAQSKSGLVVVIGRRMDEILQPWWARLQAEVLLYLLAAGAWSMAFVIWRRRMVEAQQNQHSAQSRARALLDSLSEMAWFRSKNGEYLSANPALEALCQRRNIGGLGLHDRDIWPEDVALVVEHLSETALAMGQRYAAEIQLTHHDGVRQYEISCVPARSGDAVAGIARDITDNKQRQTQLKQLAETDQLTHLPNRRVAELALARLRVPTTLLFVDLDRFKTVNDTFGHKLGDQLLIEASRRLLSACGPNTQCSRLGGDEFLVMLEDIDLARATRLAETLLTQFSLPYALGAAEIALGASIGIARYPHDAHSGEELLMAADSAMYAAKASGRQSVKIYTPDMGREAQEKMEMEAHLRHALELNQIQLHYQPQLTPSGRVCGFEALMRWHHPTLGQVPPARFIPLAEECGLIRHLGTWALKEAATLSARLRAAGFPARMSVNVSVAQLTSAHLAGAIQNALHLSGARHEDFEIEVTESMLMQSPQQARDELEQIRAMGVAVALDDFGTGFSSLGQLADLPISRLKMDKSFVTGLPLRHDAAALARTICELGQRLGLAIVAEGVELRAELDFLQACGCDEIQGFYFARPMPEEDLMKWNHQSLNGFPELQLNP